MIIINILAVLGVIAVVFVIVAVKASKQPKPSELITKKCGCGKTKDIDGYCDDSHNNN